jgi:hypothetical protein
MQTTYRSSCSDPPISPTHGPTIDPSQTSPKCSSPCAHLRNPSSPKGVAVDRDREQQPILIRAPTAQLDRNRSLRKQSGHPATESLAYDNRV